MSTKPKQNKKRSGLLIASDWEPDSSIIRGVTTKGFYYDGQGNAYMQQGMKFYDAGKWDQNVHGLPVPLVKKQRKKLQIGTA